MIGKPGPFQVIESEGNGCVDAPIDPPRRRYSCDSYSICLDLAAALNWDSFTCRGCNGSVDECLIWRALQAKKKDQVAERICSVGSRSKKTRSVDPSPPPKLYSILGKR